MEIIICSDADEVARVAAGKVARIAEAVGPAVVIGVATTNGLVEAGVAAVLVSAVCAALSKFLPYNSIHRTKT